MSTPSSSRAVQRQSSGITIYYTAECHDMTEYLVVVDDDEYCTRRFMCNISKTLPRILHASIRSRAVRLCRLLLPCLYHRMCNQQSAYNVYDRRDCSRLETLNVIRAYAMSVCTFLYIMYREIFVRRMQWARAQCAHLSGYFCMWTSPLLVHMASNRSSSSSAYGIHKYTNEKHECTQKHHRARRAHLTRTVCANNMRIYKVV